MALPSHIRVRCFEGHPLIYELLAARSRLVRFATMASTGIGWGFWLYLWLPILALIHEPSGVQTADFQWIAWSGWIGLIEFIFHAAPYAWIPSAVLLIWAIANYLRFRGKERRKARISSSAEADSRWTQTTVPTLRAGRTMKNLVCRHDDHGWLLGVESPFPVCAGEAFQNCRVPEKMSPPKYAWVSDQGGVEFPPGGRTSSIGNSWAMVDRRGGMKRLHRFANTPKSRDAA